jgi:hypothetical protein
MQIFEFFDAAFFRLVWVLFIDFLITTGYLEPSQRQPWVDGYVYIIGAFFAMVFSGIWMHHKNKRELADGQSTTKTNIFSIVRRLLDKIVIITPKSVSETPQQ